MYDISTVQDSIDLFLGNHVVEETENITKPSPLRQDRDWKFFAVSVRECYVESVLHIASA